MRYLKSPMFEAGLALLIAEVASIHFVREGERHVMSPPPEGAIGFTAEYSEASYELPIALTFSGLAVATIAASRVK